MRNFSSLTSVITQYNGFVSKGSWVDVENLIGCRRRICKVRRAQGREGHQPNVQYVAAGWGHCLCTPPGQARSEASEFSTDLSACAVLGTTLNEAACSFPNRAGARKSVTDIAKQSPRPIKNRSCSQPSKFGLAAGTCCFRASVLA